MRINADIHHGLVVLGLDRDGLQNRHAFKGVFRRAIVDENLVPAQEFVLEGKFYRGEIRVAVARKEFEAIEAKARPEIQVDDQPQHSGALSAPRSAHIQSRVAIVVDQIGQRRPNGAIVRRINAAAAQRRVDADRYVAGGIGALGCDEIGQALGRKVDDAAGGVGFFDRGRAADDHGREIAPAALPDQALFTADDHDFGNRRDREKQEADRAKSCVHKPKLYQ